MSPGEELAAWLPGRLSELVRQHGVPGAQVAVLVDGEIVEAAAGVLSLATRVETTTDSVFQMARSPRCGPRRSRCSWWTRACSTWTSPW